MKLRSAITLASAALAFAALTLASTLPSGAADKIDPVADAKAFRKFFTDKFPKVKLEDFVNGPYSMNEDLYRQWQEKEQFPPYEFSLEMGKEMFSKPFKNGKSYEDCFPNKGIGVRQNYPYFDEKEGKVITLELALNRCREANGEPPFSYVRYEMAALTAYMAFTSRGKPMDIKIPDDPRALAAYENGKEYFYTRRGQLNFSCATCHVQSPGERIRAEILAPALGIVNAMPIYRSEWSGMGTTSRRFTTCNSQIRGVPLSPRTMNIATSILPVLCQQRAADFRSGSAAMRIKKLTSLLSLVLLAAGATCALAAGSEDEFKAAYAAADAANKEAGKLRNQWTTTAATLAAAKKSADAGEFDKATASAKEAEALAKASIFQATSEKTRWKDLEIR
jgi:sulfur-oxidizing protein SoxA